MKKGTKAQSYKERGKGTKVQRHKAEKPFRSVPLALCAFVPIFIRLFVPQAVSFS
jgi:hypothetical protein